VVIRAAARSSSARQFGNLWRRVDGGFVKSQEV
jgi:hypothetical protein